MPMKKFQTIFLTSGRWFQLAQVQKRKLTISSLPVMPAIWLLKTVTAERNKSLLPKTILRFKLEGQKWWNSDFWNIKRYAEEKGHHSLKVQMESKKTHMELI